MSDMFGNHIVGFSMRWLKLKENSSLFLINNVLSDGILDFDLKRRILSRLLTFPFAITFLQQDLK